MSRRIFKDGSVELDIEDILTISQDKFVNAVIEEVIYYRPKNNSYGFVSRFGCEYQTGARFLCFGTVKKQLEKELQEEKITKKEFSRIINGLQKITKKYKNEEYIPYDWDWY